MNPILIIAGLLVGWLLLRPLLRLAFTGLVAGRVARKVLAGQPDAIHLVPAGPDAWTDAAYVERCASALHAEGFVDAGTFTVRELPGFVVRLLASAKESLTAAVYEHPKAGHWCELFYSTDDGMSATFTTSPPTGLAERPGHPVTRLAGGDTPGLLALARAHQPTGWLTEVRAETAPHCFEEACSEALAWRKSAGISRLEVVNVARKRAA